MPNTPAENQAQPSPPLTLPPRSGGLRQRIWTTLGVLMFAGALVAMLVYTGPALLSDWQVHAAAQPLDQGRIVKGSCSTKVVFAICDVTLQNRTKSGLTTRSVNYVFTDVHTGNYQAEVMADPAHPELLTTDLGLDKLWNRTITFIVAFVMLVGFVVLPVLAFFRNRAQDRTQSRAAG